MREQTDELTRLKDPLLRWYDANRRFLPWREVVSPYRTWVSEIMLQQTRVAAVLPYFERFMVELPDAAALAAVSDERLMKLWEGLGYYSRARNLKRAAETIALNGFPETYEGLIALPGIGDYTAGAILSIAMGQAVPAVDGNVLRIVARLTADGGDILDAAVRKRCRAQIASAMSRERPGAYNQALMDLGATVCLPGTPDCDACPAAAFCRARAEGRAGELPVRKKKPPRRVEERTVLVLLQGGRVALRKRPEEGLLGGLWEFPGLPGSLDERAVAHALAERALAVTGWEKKLAARHIFTHLEWHMTGYVLSVRGAGEGDWRWCDEGELLASALPSAHGKFTAEAAAHLKKTEKDGR